MELRHWINYARSHNGWTLAQMAEALGRSKSNIGLWEAGNHSPSYDQILQIAKLTGLPLPHELELDQSGVPRQIFRPSGAFEEMGVPTIGEVTIQQSVWQSSRGDPVTSDGHLEGIAVKDAYAVRMNGDGAHPTIKHHQFLVLSETAQPALGDLCMVETRSDKTWLAEFLAGVDGTLSMTTLEGRRLTIPRSDVGVLHAVVAVASKTLWRAGKTDL